MDRIKEKRIGVLMGGTSSEREISLKTGSLIASSLMKKGYEVRTIDASTDLPSQLLKEKVEVAYIALHGKYGEDGCVQGLLEVMNIPYTGSGVTASVICMDKALSKKIFEYHGIPTPKYYIYKRETKDIPPIRYPVVIKPCHEGSTIGVSIVEKDTEVTEAINRALQYDNTIIIEEYIEGREITASILGDKPLPLVEIIPVKGFYDYTSKTTKGMAEYIVPAKVSSFLAKKIQAIALEAHRATGCHYVSRVDFRVDRGENPHVLEINTIPGMTETSLLPLAAGKAGITYDELVESILVSAFTKGPFTPDEGD